MKAELQTLSTTGAGTDITSIFKTGASFITWVSLEKKYGSSTLTFSFHGFKAWRWPGIGQVHVGIGLH